MNITLLSGRVTRDPELRYTANNNAIASFSLAVDRRDENKNTDFFNCIAWKKTGELIGKYVSKGDKITIRGRLQNRSWEDQDGTKHSVTEVIVDEVEFSPKADKMEKPADKPMEKPAPKPAPKPQEIPEPGFFDGLGDEENCPF